QQAAARPDAIAVSGGGQQLSFGELERRSNRLGHYLRRRGVGPEQVVGLLVERTPQAVVGMLAVLKAGGAYLPLDGGSPPGRQQTMLEDAEVRLVVAEASQAERVGQAAMAAGAEVMVLEQEAAAIAAAGEAECEGGAVA